MLALTLGDYILVGYLPQGLGWNAAKFPQDTGHQRYEVFHPITYCLNHKHSNRQSGKVLLKLKIPVHRQEYIELSGGEAEQLSIFDSRPSATLNRRNLVTNQHCSETTREILVKQNTHRG